MATNSGNGNGSQLLLVGDSGGITVINPSTPLKRLNYFDGKFLRAADFDVEQRYLRQLVAISNQGLGPGVVYGFDTTLGNGDNIQIGPGLAIDPSGKVLLLQTSFSQSIQALIDASKKVATKAPDASGKTGSGAFSDCLQIAAPPPVAVVPVSDIYAIVICSAEALCGQEDVYGVLCQDACITSTDRPYRLDGIVVRAIPLQLVTPFPTSKALDIGADLYLRSKVAHSWYADEMLKHPSAISGHGLLSETWCLGAGYDGACCEVPLAVVARAGATTLFLDAWIVRRERIDAPARRYWQWKMRMRPWDVFLAQVLQFQCQLAGLLSGIVTPGSRGGDPCASQHQALNEAAQFVDQVRSGLASFRNVAANASLSERPALLSLSLTQISDLQHRLQTILKTASTPAQPTDRILVRGGIIELPPAGYLPVITGTSVSVNDQVRALLGEGLDLRFCITTADYIAHAVEEAQHMDRISLLEGLDDPSKKPHVDILVPDGKVTSSTTTPSGGLYHASLAFSAEQIGGLVHKGAAREELLTSGGTALYTAMAGVSQSAVRNLQTFAMSFVGGTPITIKGNLATNVFVKDPVPDSQLDALVAQAAALARNFMAGATSAPTAGTIAVTAVAPPPTTVDGLWLKARTENEIKSLKVSNQTAVSLRIVVGTFSVAGPSPTPPLAIELDFNGTLSIDSVSSTAAGLVLTGRLNGILSIGILRENQSQQSTTEYLFSERFDWASELTYAGDDSNGSIRLDLILQKGTDTITALRLIKTFSGSSLQITYDLALVSTINAQSTSTPLGKLGLIADGDVINPENLNHIYAEHGLNIIQAALIVSEPAFKTNAEALLFPSLPPATKEFTIQAIRDWVAFTKRREEECAVEVVPAPLPPPRNYRVIDVRVNSADDANAFVAEFTAGLSDPAKLAELIQLLLIREERSQHIKLVVTFAGGSATAQSDLAAAEKDWKTFSAGVTIYLAAIGAAGEIDPGLQINRIRTFESAIAAESREDPATSKEITIIPYSDSAKPPDADGIMLFVTATFEQQHVFAANERLYPTVKEFATSNSKTLAQWSALLKELKDLGLASYSADPSGAVSVADDAVKAAFPPPGSGTHVVDSFVLSRQGDPSAADTNRVAAAQEVVQHLDVSGPAPKSQTYSGTWPINDAPSILFVEIHVT